MAKAKTAEKTNTAPLAEPAKNAGAMVTQQPQAVETVAGLRPRLPYPRKWCEYHGISPYAWVTLINGVWPSAKTPESVCMAITYCKAKGLDPMKKPVHIVPVWSKAAGGEVETIWPAITEVRITATRTKLYAGKDAMEVGPIIKRKFVHEHEKKVTEKEIEFPEWMRLTVYKIVQGVRCAFVGPKVYWLEAYASESKWSEVPNDMWAERINGQLDKCAEAASLRAAFPEELGDAYVPEEMAGRIIEGLPPGQPVVDLENPEHVAPRENKNSEFKRAEPSEGDKRQTASPKQAVARTDMIDVAEEDVNQDDDRHPEDQPQQSPEDATAELKGILDAGIARLPTAATMPLLAKLRDEVVREFPYASAFEKVWLQACADRQREILNAKKPK